MTCKLKSKVYQISDKSVHRELRKGNKRQPKLQIRTLVISHFTLQPASEGTAVTVR